MLIFFPKDAFNLNRRRIIPKIEYAADTFSVTKSGSNIDISFNPGNCLFDLPPMILKNSFDESIAILSKVSNSSPPVTGTFGITWNDQTLNSMLSKFFLFISSY